MFPARATQFQALKLSFTGCKFVSWWKDDDSDGNSVSRGGTELPDASHKEKTLRKERFFWIPGGGGVRLNTNQRSPIPSKNAL